MTLPYERSRSLEMTERFLESLLDSKLTPGVPRKVREAARACLRHYPTAYDRQSLAYLNPELLKNDY